MLLVLMTLVLIFASKSAAGTKGYESKPTSSTQSIQTIVQDIQKWQENHSASRPFVTVTYAQSIDGKIAVCFKNTEETSSNFALSDPESLRMTHALRSIHDAILVGGRTLSVDNPRLNNRLWNPQAENQPRPIVLDTHLTHVRKLGGNCRANKILVCCSREAAAKAEGQAGLPELLPCAINSDTGKIDLRSLLKELKMKYQVESIMVEGGASVLTEVYNQLDLVDCLCITIAPKLLLQCGLSAIIQNDAAKNGDGKILNVDNFESTKFLNLSKDSIFLAKLLHESKKR
jgi:riboflavin-specific deaminase-like protein